MIEAKTIFEDTMEWLKKSYGNWCFFMERDIVWVLQNHMIPIIRDTRSPYRLFYNFEMYPNNKSSKNKELYQSDEARNRVPMAADLVIFNDDKKIVEIAIEIKYEPSHQRKYNPKGRRIIPADFEPAAIWHGKFPIAFFSKKQAGKSPSVEKDIERIIKYTTDRKARYAYAIFIDEGRYYRDDDATEPFPGSEWRDWELSHGLFPHVSVLWAQTASANPEDIQPFW